MKLWMSALVVVLISSQSFAAEAVDHTAGKPAAEVGAAVTDAKPVAEAKPFHERYANAVNACLLQQGAVGNVEGATRAIGEDLAARR